MYDNGHIHIMNISVTPTVRCGARIGLDGGKLIKRNIPSKAASRASQLLTVTCTLHNYAQYKKKQFKRTIQADYAKDFFKSCSVHIMQQMQCNRLDINQMKS